ncbi:MAG: hypothetical protein JOZ57_17600, partial [Abitibacteriaceae bacterium]|nr:hypothetical protein [Abditibacteriaceae bacterium]
SLPPKALKTFNVAVRVSENAPSLKQPQWFKHFRFDLELPTLAAVEADALPKQAAAEPPNSLITEAEGVKAEWQSLDASDYNLRARLWLADTLLAASNPTTARGLDTPREWFIKDMVGRDQAGKEYKAEWDELNSDHLYFKLDGRPAHAHEWDQALSFSFPDNHKPEKFSIEAVVEPVQHWHQVFNFSAVPIPQPGAIAEVNQEVKGASGARTILRRVIYFNEPDQLSGAPRKLRDKLQPARGLALVFEAVPTAGNGTGQETKQNLNFTFAHDNQGRDLNANKYSAVAPADALVATMPPEPYRWTVFLLPPAANATTLNVQVVTDEIRAIGPARTVTFKDVPLPQPRPIFL